MTAVRDLELEAWGDNEVRYEMPELLPSRAPVLTPLPENNMCLARVPRRHRSRSPVSRVRQPDIRGIREVIGTLERAVTKLKQVVDRQMLGSDSCQQRPPPWGASSHSRAR